MKYRKTTIPTIVAAVLLIAAVGAAFASSGAARPLSAQEALDQLRAGVHRSADEISFAVPAGYPEPRDWNILVAGRAEADGFGMSVHLFENENLSHSWEAGRRYVIPLDVHYTDLLLNAFLPDGQGGFLELNVDLLGQ